MTGLLSVAQTYVGTLRRVETPPQVPRFCW